MNYDWNWEQRWRREQRRMERPSSPDEFHVRTFTNNLAEVRCLVEGRSSGVHCDDKTFKTHPDALAYAKMEANWHGAKLIDHVGKPA